MIHVALVLASALSFSTRPLEDDAAWQAAMALKQKAAYAEAAAKFADYARDHAGSPRAIEARIECGVCWFSVGKTQQKLLRNDAGSTATLNRALALFEGVVTEHPADPLAGRAQYMCGSARLWLGDVAGAEAEYDAGFKGYASDAKYAPKCLERRAAMRRHLLRTPESLADLRDYLRLFPRADADDKASVERYLELGQLLDKPAPPLSAGAWVQGDPATLESLRGDVVMLYFFAKWCEQCEKARPFVLDVFDRYEPMGVRMIGLVDQSKGQTAESVRAWLPEKKIRFPVAIDDGSNARRAKATKIPHMILLDRAGVVRWSDNPQNLQDATIEALLVEDTSAPKK